MRIGGWMKKNGVDEAGNRAKEMKTQEEKRRQMVEAPVSKLIPGLAVPTIISMLVTSIYNMADTFFVSQIGTSASGAVGVIFSAMAMIQALGFCLGMGSGNYISRSLGNQNMKEAGKAASTAFFTALGLGVIIAVGGNLYLHPLVMFLGSTETIAPYAQDYARYILLAAPFMTCSFVMNNILRSQGNAMYAMVGITTGGVLNMILDPIFIFTLDLGTAGAALATGLSQMISFAILLFQCNGRKDCISIRFRDFSPTLKMYWEILYAGFPSFARQSIASASVIVLNVAAGPFGDAAIAAMSIVSRFMLFLNSALIGFGQGFQPVCGFNFGARKYGRVLEAYWFCVKVAVVMLTVLGLVCIGFSREIVTLFRREDMEVIEIGTLALRLQLLTLPIQAWITMANMLSQSIGYGFRATLVAIGRQGLFLIPALCIMPSLWGIRGIQFAQPVADLCTLVLATVVIMGIIKELKALEKQEKEKEEAAA